MSARSAFGNMYEVRNMGIRLGCKRDARRALQGQLEMIGQGSSRDVYVNQRNTLVYKVDQYADDADWKVGWSDNLIESSWYEGLIQASGASHEHIAPTTVWKIGDHVVICQPFYATLGVYLRDTDPVTYDALVAIAAQAAMEYGLLKDFHDWNWALDADGIPVLFDFNYS